MQRTPNFNTKQILSQAELIAWDESLRELFGNIIRYGNINSKGILDFFDPSTGNPVNDFFDVVIGTTTIGGFNTIKIGAGRGIFNIENLTNKKIAWLADNNEAFKSQMVSLFKWAEKDNIEIPGISSLVLTDSLYVGFIPIYNPMEDGECIISINNQVTIAGGDFSKLRDHSTKNPSKVIFTELDGTACSNDQIYEVITIIDPENMVISGTVSAESNLKMVIVGSYDLSVQGNLDDKSAYSIVSGDLIFTATESDIQNEGGFVICRLDFANDHSFSIIDLRSVNLYQYSVPEDVVYKSIVQTITGRKKFSVGVPTFASFIEYFSNTQSLAAPIEPVDTFSGNTSILTIPDQEGSLFYIKCSPTSAPISSIVMGKTILPGTSMMLKVADSSADDVVFVVHVEGDAYVAGELKANNYGISEAPNIKVKKGGLLFLMLDHNDVWNIVNNEVQDQYDDWHLLNGLTDGNGDPLSSTTNIIRWKKQRDFGVIFVQEVDTPDFPINFGHPFILSYPMDYIIHLGPDYDVYGKVRLYTNGTGEITAPASIVGAFANTINSPVFIPL